ncbi:hypothetical protein H6G97_22630 [Nostoc flagelliforme FACHB-838]|uniref:Uncharacterized protein n=1 Tax=Nostoc flagelliforme FACHB-838 TaxID=2692904 RepID=A0ABR8DRY7_9NOSO|nr:hypothetical protein [Nostoc flagelliforme]MBD2532222.1 hypothetical protein [Nostoc flagelliforme FACHB-838]
MKNAYPNHIERTCIIFQSEIVLVITIALLTDTISIPLLRFSTAMVRLGLGNTITSKTRSPLIHY